MTWWEVEQMAEKVIALEEAMDAWTLSGPEMRIEQQTVKTLAEKIQRAWDRASQRDKKAFLMELAERVELLHVQLTERLKREVSRYV